MAAQLASTTVCSICGEPLNAKGECLACLLRTGLDKSRVETEPLPSLVFGDFEIARREDGSLWELGRGAFGVTYLAVDNVLRRKVALKVIDVPAAARTSPAMRERFLREARVAAALRHPNVAAVFQFGASPDGNRCYYAMELVEGETLEARVRKDGPLNAKLVLEIAIQITRALIAAAAQGLIHRDLKPGNIMLTSGNAATAELEVKVIDFGLAKAIADAGGEMDLTHGEFVGTPNFASPEQFGSGPVDARSDLYSLGATLWFALTGKTPFAGCNIEEIRSVQKSDALPMEQLKAARVPSRLRSLLKSMLAFEPAARPGAHDLLKALKDLRRNLEFESFFMNGFFDEVKRRKVYRVAAAYIIAAAGIIQLASAAFPAWDLPNSALRLVIVLLLIGFPIALILGWVFDITAHGIRVTPGTHRRLNAIVLVAAGVIISSAAGFLLLPRVSAHKIDKSIAVLPFENLSKDEENAFFASGVQDEILTDLSKVADLKVISRTSVMKYKSGLERNLREIAKT